MTGLTACGSDGDDGGNGGSTPTAATAAESPRDTEPPAGVVTPAPQIQQMVTAGDRVASLGDGDALSVRSIANPAEVTEVPVDGVTAVAADGDGFLAVSPSAVIRVGPQGAADEKPADLHDPISVAAAGERVLVGTSDGRLLVLDRNGALQREIGGGDDFTAIDQILVAPESAGDQAGQVVLLDRAQSKVTPVDVATGEVKASLRAGNGATRAVVDHYGRITAANTRDDQIVGFFGQPIVMRFRFPTGPSPYAVAYDEQRNLLWVSTTGDNLVTAYDLASGQPRERGRVPTVGQVTSMAVAPDGTLLLASGRGDGLQTVPVDAQNLR